MPSSTQVAALPFHLMAKPSGPACNLDCTYCFYLDKEALSDRKQTRRMSPEVVDAYVRQTIEATPARAPVQFTWQGGSRRCWGGCPKHRFTQSEDGEAGLNYLCAGYTHYLETVTPWIAALAKAIRDGRDPAVVGAMAAPR